MECAKNALHPVLTAPICHVFELISASLRVIKNGGIVVGSGRTRERKFNALTVYVKKVIEQNASDAHI